MGRTVMRIVREITRALIVTSWTVSVCPYVDVQFNFDIVSISSFLYSFHPTHILFPRLLA